MPAHMQCEGSRLVQAGGVSKRIAARPCGSLAVLRAACDETFSVQLGSQSLTMYWVVYTELEVLAVCGSLLNTILCYVYTFDTRKHRMSHPGAT